MEYTTHLILLIILTLIYIFFKTRFNYWKSRNVPCFEASIPLGNISFSFYRLYGQELEKLYNKFKEAGYKYAGFYMATSPVFVPLDPDIIRNILTKDFNYFNDRGIYINEKKEFITGNLFALSGPKWKKLRAKFTPTFSTAKLKVVLETMLHSAENLKYNLQTFERNHEPFDIRDLCSRYTIDIICSSAFGIECNSLKNPEEEFRKYSKILLETNFWHGAKLAMAISFPTFFKMLNINFFRKDFTDFFVNAIQNVVHHREKTGLERKDIMDLMMKMRNNKPIEANSNENKIDECITMEELIAQCFAFFVAGYDTSSNTMVYTIFELAKNQEIQSKLRVEIYDVLMKFDGHITYDGIKEMELLDRVVCETMRKYPPVVVLNRKCAKEYKVPDTNVVLEKDTAVFISLLGLHHDPEYYPNPDKYDPERFTKDEIEKRHPFVYLPFGEGPKNCIGLRFGLLQAKIGIIKMLENHRYTLHSKTKLPLSFKTEAVLLGQFDTIWLQAHKL